MAENTLPLFAKSGKFYVYLYRDPRPNKKNVPIYVGKGSGRRADIHWREGASNQVLERIFKKLRSAELEPIVEIVGWFEDESKAFALEIALIAKFGRRNLRAGPLCNLTDGGEGPSGHKQSPEHVARLAELSRKRERTPEERERVRKKLLGHSVSAETRAKISEANKGHVVSEEHREKLRISQTKLMADPAAREARRLSSTGRKHSAEACAKIGDAHRGMKHTEETKQIIREKRMLQTIRPHTVESRLKMSEARKRVVDRKREQK